MRFGLACLSVVLAFSCCRKTDGLVSRDSGHMPKRQAQIGDVMRDHYGRNYAFEIRGPLTIAQFEAELIRSYEELAKIRQSAHGATVAFEDSGTGKSCARLKGQYQDGDELYFFKSDRRSWRDLEGREGYVLIRRGKMADMMVTAIN